MQDLPGEGRGRALPGGYPFAAHEPQRGRSRRFLQRNRDERVTRGRPANRGRRGDPAAFQPAPQPLASPCQPALNGPDGTAQSRGGLLIGQPFEVAEYQGQPEPLRQPLEFLVELRPGLGAPLLDGEVRRNPDSLLGATGDGRRP